MIIHNDFPRIEKLNHKIETNYLLLGKIGYADLLSLLKSIRTKEIILLNSFPYWKKEELKIYAYEKIFHCTILSEKEAWISECKIEFER